MVTAVLAVLALAAILIGLGVLGVRAWRRFGGGAVLAGAALVVALIGALLAAAQLYAPNPLVDGRAPAEGGRHA